MDVESGRLDEEKQRQQEETEENQARAFRRQCEKREERECWSLLQQMICWYVICVSFLFALLVMYFFQVMKI